MSGRNIAIAVMAVAGIVILVLVLSAICGNGKDGLSSEARDLVEAAPQGTEALAYWNLQDLGDENLQDLVTQWDNANRETLTAFGVDAEDVDHVSQALLPEGSVLAMKGDIDKKVLRENLETLGYDDKDFGQGHEEVWESQDGTQWLCITEGWVIAGDKDAVIEYIYVMDGQSSMADSKAVLAVMEELPRGSMVLIQKYGDDPPYDDLEAVGASLRKKDSQNLKATIIYRFSTSGAARDAEEDLYYDVDEYYDKVDIKQEGRSVQVEAEIEIDDMVLWDVTARDLE